MESARVRWNAARLGIVLARSWLPALLLGGFALIGQQIALELDNTLHHNGRWQSGKLELELGVVGAAAYLTTRSPLQGNHLDLSDWHGFQEVLYREPVELARLDLDFSLRRNAQVSVILGRTSEHFAAVRLSRYPAAPSACIRGGSDGGFLATRPLAGEPGWGWTHLTLRADGTGVEVLLDGERVGHCDFALPLHGQLGFRGGYHTARVDDVVILDARGRVIRETFAGRRNAARAFGVSLGLGLLVVAGVLLARLRWGDRNAPWHLSASLAALVLVGAATLAWSLDRFYLSGLHPSNVDPEGYPNRIESEEHVLARLRQRAVPKAAGVQRILFVGSSQTWGAGARSADDTFVARLQRRLDADREPPVECINAGISGLVAQALFRHYAEEWLALAPDVVVLDLGNNDSDPDDFRAALEQFIRLDAERGIRTVLIPEPNTPEPNPELGSLAKRHAVVRELAAAHDLPLIELQRPLADADDTGFLWWDRVHLTSFGHRLVAERLYAERAKILAD